MPGEVVYDSIIQNKSKIKLYWEQLMLAADLASKSNPSKNISSEHATVNSHTTSYQPQTSLRVHHVISPDLSDSEYYDALSHCSPQTPDLVGHEGEKLNETVVERDIRLQQERELALMIERQKALKSAKEKANKPAPMKEKEKEDEAYLSIPTTDEGNFSEYGSEDKEDHSPDESRVTSPVIPVDINSHHRTQSMDSMSSGHSSASGNDFSVPKIEKKPNQKQTFGPVRPLDEPEDIDIIRYAKYEKETPIEREIRLAREREEELRREKYMSTTQLASPTPQKTEPEKKKENGERIVTQRASSATQRVQQEIELTNEREKELKRWNSEELQKDSNIKMVLKPAPSKKPNSIPVIQNGEVNKVPVEPQIKKDSNVNKTGGPSPKIYIQNPQQKGLMKRFLATRGKMGSTTRLNNLTSPKSPSTSTLPAIKTPALSPNSLLSEPVFSFTSLVQTKEREELVNLGTRPGYKSAEDKIQSELKEMKRREEELRQQRRSNLYSARSQPDLLNMNNETTMKDILDDEPTQLPNTSKLRSALSVQNLLDVEEKPAPRRTRKGRSLLIEQWENRIQNNN